MRLILWSLMVTLALASSALAASKIVVVFEYPRSLSPSGFVFTVTVEGQPTPITMTVSASAPGACVAAGESANPDIYCGSLGCFPPGSRIGITAQAQVGDQLSGPSNVGGCIVDMQCNCVGIPGDRSPVDVLTTPGPTAPPFVSPAPVTASIPPPPMFPQVPLPPPAPQAAGPT
jgi:hypothetical protein